jgi:oligoendopeptidase F
VRRSAWENYANSYPDFLSASCSVYPLDALKGAGIDLTTPEPVERALASLVEVMDRLEELGV